MSTILPPETLLEIFKLLPLGTALKAREVGSQWRDLILTCDMPPVRRDLFNLYVGCIKSKAFIESRPWVKANLKPFDRQAYIDAIYEQKCDSEGTLVEAVIPEHFLIWILEWPAVAAIPNLWPGLPFPFNVKEGMRGVRGCNHLARIPPVLSKIDYMPDASNGDIFFTGPCLLVYADSPNVERATVWLSLDGRWKGKTVCYVGEPDDAFIESYDVEMMKARTETQDIVPGPMMYQNWTQFLREEALPFLEKGKTWNQRDRREDQYWRVLLEDGFWNSLSLKEVQRDEKELKRFGKRIQAALLLTGQE